MVRRSKSNEGREKMSMEAFDPPIGIAQTVSDGVRRIVAPNPSPMTFRGTNTYLVGDQSIAVIDPGPASEAHLDAILAAAGDTDRITHILVTHTHLDHTPLAARLAKVTGAKVYAFGGADAGRSDMMQRLAATGALGGGEGIDAGFACDEQLVDGAQLSSPEWTLEAIHTPGHIGNHLCFALGPLCFSGDHVMGWASSLVSPPDGDLTDFMESCARLQTRSWKTFLPGHGDIITQPHERLEWLIAHRQSREAAILAALEQGPATADALAHVIYTETPVALLPAASRNVLAHLIDLLGKSRVQIEGDLHARAAFALR